MTRADQAWLLDAVCRESLPPMSVLIAEHAAMVRQRESQESSAWCRKIFPADIQEARKLRYMGATYREIGEMFQVSGEYIRLLIARRG